MIRKLLTHKLVLCTLIFVTVLGLGAALLIAISYGVISPHQQYILNPSDTKTIRQKNVRVGMVLGAGITNEGKPFKELRARLDVAADAMDKGYVDKLIVSGDNRFENYDEPTAMKTYLIEEKGIDPSKIQPDFAGRSTYESCERAGKVFQQKQLIIISAESHLPRAIYLCRHFGIESYGLASQLEANNSTRREALARVKAVYNLYIRGEPTVLGNPITL